MLKNITSIFIGLSLSFSLGAALTDEQKKAAEESISLCEKKEKDLKNGRSAIVNLKKPSALSSNEKKKIYENKDNHLKAFDQQFAEFTRFLTDNKIKIRGEYSKSSGSANNLQGIVKDFSSNCTRASDGIMEFVKYTESGIIKDKVYQSIFSDWLNYAKCGARTCK